jgi:exopolysaccharide production protein ExoQ
MARGHRWGQAFLVVALFTLLAGDAWRYSITWYGWGIIALLVLAAAIVLLVRHRDSWRISALPYPLLAFLALASASIAWSYYPGASALGVLSTLATVTVAVAIAVAFSWRDILSGLGMTLRIILGGSLLFELVVSLFVRHPVLPFWVDYGSGDIPQLLYWSRNELFEVFDGGRIQGIVGNASTLAMIAAIGVVVFGVQLALGRARRAMTVGWLAVAVLTLAFTRSATITVALAAAAIVLVAILLVRRAATPRRRAITLGGILVVLVGAVAACLAFSAQLLSLLGKSDDLTGRLGIWEKVVALAQERPVQGWGWVSHWVPWVAPFDDLAFRNGVRQLHAHNAWIDLWFQLGILGLIVFGALVLSTAVRAWFVAVDRSDLAPKDRGSYTAITLLPVLLLVLLLVQSVAESRLLVEYGLTLLVVIAIKTKDAERQRSSPAGALIRP